MNQQSFASILDEPGTEFVRPPAFPAGSYIAMVKGLPRRDKSTKKGTEFVEFTLSFISPVMGEEGPIDIDADALEAFGEVQGKEMKLTFYLSEKSAYRLQEFLVDDLRIERNDRSLWETAQDAPGHQVIVHVRQKPRDDGKGMYSEISSTAPVEE